jgi:hypothetical protein
VKLRAVVLAVASLAGGAAALACGVCAEDKMAATYDHAVVERATAAGHAMVYCEVVGRFDAVRARQAARRVRGVDESSLRVSAQPAALSFALDTRQQSAQAAVQALQAAAPRGTQLKIISVMASHANVRAPGMTADAKPVSAKQP